ncbi:MAG TPA: hypothetical protein VF846_10250, partial [Thermoanaerobaculia bacterium]
THAFRLEPVAELTSGRLYLSRSGVPGELMLRFVALRGVTYQIEAAADLVSANWQPLGNPITGSGGIITVRVPQSGERGFWRVVELP